MHETEYAYAVARIRANETKLLTRADIDQLIEAESYEQQSDCLPTRALPSPKKARASTLRRRI